ncbi:MAG TPA: hypothetical protein VHJ34_14415 [Actinomycetota bacterium]|nr:hypothetical protein [Actinomycetota bacterium]
MGKAGPTGALKVIAWLVLVVGVVMGLFIALQSVQEQLAINEVTFETEVEQAVRPGFVAAGVVVALQAILAWAALLVFATMADNVAAMTRSLASGGYRRQDDTRSLD